MTRKELLKALKELKEAKALVRSYKANMKTVELENIYNESMRAIEKEIKKESEKEMKKENTKKEMTLKEELTQMFKDNEIKEAHGGYAVKINNKRALEVTKSKRTNLYKICAHKNTTVDAKIQNLHKKIDDRMIHCETQKYCYCFRDLDNETFRYIAEKLFDAKKIRITEYEKEADANK